jgi:hypothetical protein
MKFLILFITVIAVSYQQAFGRSPIEGDIELLLDELIDELSLNNRISSSIDDEKSHNAASDFDDDELFTYPEPAALIPFFKTASTRRCMNPHSSHPCANFFRRVFNFKQCQDPRHSLTISQQINCYQTVTEAKKAGAEECYVHMSTQCHDILNRLKKYAAGK